MTENPTALRTTLLLFCALALMGGPLLGQAETPAAEGSPSLEEATGTPTAPTGTGRRRARRRDNPGGATGRTAASARGPGRAAARWRTTSGQSVRPSVQTKITPKTSAMTIR